MASSAQAPYEETDEIRHNKQINEEYKMWKKNAPALYEDCFAHVLDWPSLTIQWFPDVREVPESNQKEFRLLIGTNTSGAATEQLQIARLTIPHTPALVKDLNADTGEIGGYGSIAKKWRFEIIQRINHEGEVNKARYMPQNPNLIASMCSTGVVNVFDRSKLPSNPSNDEPTGPQIRLVGHETEGFGLDWSPVKEGLVATGSEDTTVKVWDISGYSSSTAKGMEPIRTFNHHTATVNDVSFCPNHWNLLGTVSDDKRAAILDLRESPSERPPIYINDVADEAVNCIAWHWNPDSPFKWIVATGSTDGIISLTDLRYLKAGKKIATLADHKGSVNKVEWHPHDPCILLSGGADHRINYWDMSKIGAEQTPDEAEDGPPELCFKHGGFLDQVNDFNISKAEKWMVAAVADDNQIQIFRARRKLVIPGAWDEPDTNMEDVEE